jgi:hypothetical protein
MSRENICSGEGTSQGMNHYSLTRLKPLLDRVKKELILPCSWSFHIRHLAQVKIKSILVHFSSIYITIAYCLLPIA